MKITINDMIKRIHILKAGQSLLISGSLYTARDLAHKRIFDMINRGEEIPFKLKDSVIYYCGPAPAKPGEAIGPCGPTTSSRMDRYTPLLLSLGLKATIGKGPRSKDTYDAFRKYGALYLVTTGGVAALLSQKVKKASIVAFDDLGPEAIYKLDVEEFPVIVAYDSYGNNIFKNI